MTGRALLKALRLKGELSAKAVEAHSRELNTERSFILELTDEQRLWELAQKSWA
jgi:hypothetical protein